MIYYFCGVYDDRDFKMGYSFGRRGLFAKNTIFLTFWRFIGNYLLNNCPPDNSPLWNFPQDNHPLDLCPPDNWPWISSLTTPPQTIIPPQNFPQGNYLDLPPGQLSPNNFPGKLPPGNCPLWNSFYSSSPPCESIVKCFQLSSLESELYFSDASIETAEC